MYLVRERTSALRDEEVLAKAIWGVVTKGNRARAKKILEDPDRRALLLEIAVRIQEKERRIKQISEPKDVHDLVAPKLVHMDQEVVELLTLDNKNRVIRRYEVARGTVSASLVPIQKIMKLAIMDSAAAIVLVHNHPSGDPEPSTDDKGVTEMVDNACKLMNIRFLDHVIVARDGFYSFAAEDILSDRVYTEVK